MHTPEQSDHGERDDAADALEGLGEGLSFDRTIALVGLMGAGKTTIGRRLARALGLPFVDADVEIAAAAGKSIPEIFAAHGEAEFRRGERQVISRLLQEKPHVLATGGGAFMDPRTRELMKEKAITIWLKAPLDVLLKRVARRDDRPLLKRDDPRTVMLQLMAERHPVYAEADITVETSAGPHLKAVAAIIQALRERQASKS